MYAHIGQGKTDKSDLGLICKKNSHRWRGRDTIGQIFIHPGGGRHIKADEKVDEDPDEGDHW